MLCICHIQGTSFSDSPVLNSDQYFPVLPLINTLFITYLKGRLNYTHDSDFFHTIIIHLQQKWRFHDFVTAGNGCVCVLTVMWSICLSPGYGREMGVTHLWGTGSHWILHIGSSFFLPLWILLCMSREIWENQSHEYILRQIKCCSLRISPHHRCQSAPICVRAGCSGLPFSHWREIRPDSPSLD